VRSVLDAAGATHVDSVRFAKGETEPRQLTAADTDDFARRRWPFGQFHLASMRVVESGLRRLGSLASHSVTRVVRLQLGITYVISTRWKDAQECRVVGPRTANTVASGPLRVM
jgi:hypothetical protein